MSGYICGNIVLNGKEPGNFDEVFDRTVINRYKLDRFDCSVAGNAQFACGIIHVTDEDQFEVLPYYDAEAGLFITADVILDNRDDLIKDLALSGKDMVITDGFIVLEAYKKWGYDTPKHLLGDFAFAIWDSKKEELFITRDHTGTRSLYYTKNENSIRFSTTINPLIFQESNKQELIDEEWLTMYFALPKYVVDYDSIRTMYKNIFQAPIAQSLIVTKTEIKMFKFWDVKQQISTKNTTISRNDWLALFNQIFEESVKCRTRSIGNIGTFLSGGLDSTSVAAVASKELKRCKKKLYSFTSIPQFNVEGYDENYIAINEKKDVELFVSHFNNIMPNYVDCANQNIITSLDELIQIVEFPFKALENLVWINQCNKKAAGYDCKVMLSGQFGNFTISRGDFRKHIETLKKHGNYAEMYDEVVAFSSLHHVSKRFILKKIFIMNIPEGVKKIRRKLYGKKTSVYNPYLLYLKKDLLDKFEIIDKLKRKKFYEPSIQNLNFYDEGDCMLDELTMTHIGAYDTKFGLQYGMLIRDPTKDVRVIEFCLKAPFRLFVERGIERKLIRDAMENIVPDEIRLNLKKRGLQGGDWNERISRKRIDFFKQMELLNHNQVILHYFSKEKFDDIRGMHNELFETQNIEDLRQTIYWIIISKFLCFK